MCRTPFRCVSEVPGALFSLPFDRRRLRNAAVTARLLVDDTSTALAMAKEWVKQVNRARLAVPLPATCVHLSTCPPDTLIGVFTTEHCNTNATQKLPVTSGCGAMRSSLNAKLTRINLGLWPQVVDSGEVEPEKEVENTLISPPLLVVSPF